MHEKGVRLEWDEHYCFGFTSEAQLRSWFYKDAYLEWMEINGFILAIIETDDVIEGNSKALLIKPEFYKKVSIKEHFKI